MTNQEFFDQYAVSIWKINNQNCMRACLGFLSRLGIEIEVTGEEVWQEIEKELAKIPDLVRRPQLSKWAFNSLSQWIHAAYPTFVDEIAGGKRAVEVDLSKIRYVVPKAPAKNAMREISRLKRRSDTDVRRATVNGQRLKHIRSGAINKLH